MTRYYDTLVDFSRQPKLREIVMRCAVEMRRVPTLKPGELFGTRVEIPVEPEHVSVSHWGMFTA